MPHRLILDDISSFADDASARLAGHAGPPGHRSIADYIDQAGNIASNALRDDSSATIICTSDAKTGALLAGPAGFRVPHLGLIDSEADPIENDLAFFALGLEAGAAPLLERARAKGVVPLYRDEEILIGIARKPAMASLTAGDHEAGQLGEDGLPADYDLYLMRDAVEKPNALGGGLASFFEPKRARILTRIRAGLIVAIPADTSIEDLHFPVTHHGHNLKLIPDPALLAERDVAGDGHSAFTSLEPKPEDADWLRGEVSEQRLGELTARLSGREPVNGAAIVSRHVHHPDCERAIVEIEQQLRQSGLSPQRHFFMHEGRRLANLHADLQGESDRLVLVTAHLDSHAGRDRPDYRPASDPAPGADDDASGVAAVLEIARALTAKAERPEKTVRFALFHAEEHGLVGSRHFARAAAEAGHRIAAVFQMDMIGFTRNPDDRRFEVHYGCRASPAVEQRSAPLAGLLAACAVALGELGPAEIYRSPDDPDAPGDPADGRSDHSAFQMSGFPAVIVSEDFFGGTVDAPSAEPNNPLYHSSADTDIDTRYATAIARIVGLAAWTMAKRQS